MNGLKKKFAELEPADKIASFNLLIAIIAFVATIFSVSVAYLGYSINSAVEERNKQDWAITQANAQANNLKVFWNDIETLENNIVEQVGIVGSDAGKFMVSAFKVLDEIGSLHMNQKSTKINADNIKLTGEFSALVAAYASLQGSIEGTAVKYDNSVLIYSPMIDVLGIKGWSKYLGQASNLKKWKSETIKPYEEAYNFIHSITKSGKVPDDIESTVKDLGYKLGYSLKNMAPPSLDGILALKNENYPQNITKQ